MNRRYAATGTRAAVGRGPSAGPSYTSAMTEERKLVSVLFADTVGSTALGAEHDPELVRATMGRYFERMKQIAERHGGTVEKFIGDAVMVVFGVPRVHDDDAERAVRAGLAMRDELGALNRELAVELAARVGINSGEAVADPGATGQFLVTGDVVNMAARLQQGAEVGEVVVGALTEQLTRVAIDYTAHEPIVAKGKAAPLRAFTAVRAKSVIPDQARGLPAMRASLVGRDRELRLLLDTVARATAERAVHVFTLLGEPGVGKSRLVAECLVRLRGEPLIMRGRCLPYGAGITYWPLIEVLRAQAGITGVDDRAAAIAKLDAHLEAALPSPSDRLPVRQRLGALLGLESPAVALPDVAPDRVNAEIGWALRRYLEALTADRAAVLVIDDLQWAEPALIQVIDGILDRMRGVPLALLCAARPELTETHPGWSSGRSNASTMTLEGLDVAETATLISRLLDIDDLPSDLRAKIAARSEGNPLFCEEFLRMLIDDGRVIYEDGRWRATADAASVTVPETIVALLAAGIDRLGPAEKRALQLASIVGERFTAAEVQALAPEADPAALDLLERKGLVLEDRDGPGAGALKFKHLLVREVAYGSLSKADRAALHERFGDGLEREVGDRRDEYAEIFAHHAERAFTLSREVGLGAEVVGPRATRAVRWALALAERGDLRGEIRLLERSLAVAERAAPHDPTGAGAERIELLRIRTLVHLARFPEARAAAIAARDAAMATGDTTRAARIARIMVDIESAAGELSDLTSAQVLARELAIATGDERGALEVDIQELGWLWGAGRFSDLLAAGPALVERALALGAEAQAAEMLHSMGGAARLSGRLDLGDEFNARAREIATRLGLRLVLRLLDGATATGSWLRGDAATALQLLDAVTADALDDGDTNRLIASRRRQAEILDGERRYSEGLAVGLAALADSERTGERWHRSEILTYIGRNLLGLGRIDEAATRMAEGAAMIRGDEDVAAVAEVLAAHAALDAARGNDEAADVGFAKAVAVADRGEFAPLHVWIRLERAELLARWGRPAEAATLLAEIDRIAPPPFRFLPERRAALAAVLEKQRA